jgi:hypothetical protein
MVGGFRLTGWIFAVMLTMAPVVFLLDKTPSRFPIWIWFPWIAIVGLSLTWADSVDRRTIQDVCQILTPFVIAPIASKALKTDEDLGTLVRAFNHCSWILVGGLVARFVFGVVVLARPMAMTAAVVGCVFVAGFRERRRWAILGWGRSLLVTALTGSRMATLAVLSEWLLLPRYRRHGARIVAALFIASLAVALFYTPIFQQRFFLDDEGTISDLSSGEFSDTGRFETWAQLWEEVEERPLLGSGANSASGMVKRVWEGSDKPHNDYLKILIEQGAIGLSLFLLGVIGQVLNLRRQIRPGHGLGAVIQSAAQLGVIVFLLMAVTDNPIIYGVWFMHPLFVLLGASYAQPTVQRPARPPARPSR